MQAVQGDAYRRAGVDIDAGTRAVELMRAAVRATFGPQVLADVGHFGGVFAPDGYAPGGQAHVLVASADGVGTKLKLATLLGAYRSIGHDIVNHCINDILTCGARPLFFLDYVAASKIVPEQIAEVVAGMAEACRVAGCALIGGETAELPGVYLPGELDVAGFIVGSAPRHRLILGTDIRPGDVVLGLPSNGLHTNGYSLARKALGLDGNPQEVRAKLDVYDRRLGCTLGEALIRPHPSYLPDIAPLLDMPEQAIRGMAHITGGGLVDNIPRILPAGCAVELDVGTWPVPPVFRLIQQAGGVSEAEMVRVFNMGLGMVLVTAPEHAHTVERTVPNALRVGRVVEHEGGSRILLRGAVAAGGQAEEQAGGRAV